MRVFDKICPVCNTSFEAKRRNQLYCSSECRSDINNDKLKAKFNKIKVLEKEKNIGDQYMAAYKSAIRVVEIDFDPKQNNEYITFEGKRFEKIAPDIDNLREIGIYLGEKSVKGNKRTAIFNPNNGLLCFLRSYVISAHGVTYRMMKIEKK